MFKFPEQRSIWPELNSSVFFSSMFTVLPVFWYIPYFIT
ncbi:unnamed protein product, partial [Brassica rapa subsp. narinosa]